MAVSRKWIGAATLALLAGAMLAGPLRAQDDEAEAGPMPFAYVLRGEVQPAMMAEYTEAIGKIVSAHQQHANGNRWATYMPLTGGNAPRVHIFLPMQRIGDMDGWTPNMQVMTEAHGADGAREVFQTLQECWTPESMLVAFNPAVSNPGDWHPGPPPFAWHLQVKVHPGKLFEYIGMVQQIVQAHAGHDNGMNWVGYSNMIGGAGNEFHYFIRMEKLGEMDGWPANAQVMIDTVGEEAWQAMQKRMSEITEAQSEILVFSPPHSHVPDLDEGEG